MFYDRQNRSIIKLFALIIASFFLGEFVIKALVEPYQNELGWTLSTSIDVFLHIMIIFPSIYFFSYRHLRSSEEHFRAITETAADAIIGIKEPGYIYLWNTKAQEMFGYTAEEAVGRNVHELITPEKDRARALEATKAFFEIGTGPVVGKALELSGLKKDGTEFPVELSVSAMRIGGRWLSIGIIRDFTVRKKMENQLKNRIVELERFSTATINREIKMKEMRDKIKELEEKIKNLH